MLISKLKLLPLIKPSTILNKTYVKLNNDWNTEDSCKKRLIVNHDHRFLYCPINKNASSSILKAILELDQTVKQKKVSKLTRNDIRTYVNLNYSLSNYTFASAQQIINSNYFKFIIVRNPWARLVSTYSNFFVRCLTLGWVSGIAERTAKYIYGEKNYSKYIRKITFEQYAKYVCNTENVYLDPHSLPQYLFAGEIKYDFIGKMENLSDDFKYLNKKLNLSLKLSSTNKTKYSNSLKKSDLLYFRIPAEDLVKLNNNFPSYQKFYCQELIEIIGCKYYKDIEKFNYSFF